MDSSLLLFLRQYLGFIGAALVPVVLIAFLSIPMALGGHPGELRPSGSGAAMHMT